jgi:hypothetical protein
MERTRNKISHVSLFVNPPRKKKICIGLKKPLVSTTFYKISKFLVPPSHKISLSTETFYVIIKITDFKIKNIEICSKINHGKTNG